MKKALSIAAFLALLLPSYLSTLPHTETAKAQKAEVTAELAKIFLEASQHSIVIDTIPKGTTVTLFPSGKKNKKWLYISYLSKKRGSQVTGFVDSKRVEIIKDTAPEERDRSEESKPEPEEKKTQDEQKESEELQNLLEEMQQEQTQEVEDKKQEAGLRQEEAEKETETKTQEHEAKQEKTEELEESVQQLEEAQEEEQAFVEQEGTPADEESAEEKTQETEAEELPKVLTKVTVKVPRANIRLMPTTQSAVIHQVKSGVELKHLAKTGNWHRVNLAPNKDGIVLSGYIHQNIVDEIYETVVPPPEPEKTPEKEPEVIEEEEEAEPEPEPVKEIRTFHKSTVGKYYWVGGGAGYTMPSESHFGKGINFNGTFGFGVMKHLAIELRVPYFQRDVIGTADGLSSGRLSSLSLMLSVQGRYPVKDRFVPYLEAGGDYHLNTFRLNEEIIHFWNDRSMNIQENVDHTFGFHFGGGLDVFLMENIALNVDVRYYTANLTGKRTLANQNNQETTSGTIDNLKLNSLQAGISVKLFLNPLTRNK